MVIEPGGIIAWLLVGLIAGWLTGKVMRGGGYGALRDIILGVVGAFIGGMVMSFLGSTVRPVFSAASSSPGSRYLKAFHGAVADTL
jgi:uncharacterized membrane protein YeaQ/YmgE (transglycosylase-associated protein family)